MLLGCGNGSVDYAKLAGGKRVQVQGEGFAAAAAHRRRPAVFALLSTAFYFTDLS